MSWVSAMSDLSELFHYIFICPFIYITLAEFLNFLPQTFSTKLWKTWEHFQGSVHGENSGNVISASGIADKVSGSILRVMKSLCFIGILKLHSFIQELIKLHRRDNVTLGGCNALMNVSRLTDGRNENRDSDQRQASIPDVYLRKLRSGRLYDITPVSNILPTKIKPSGGKPQNGRSAPGHGISFRGNRRLENWFGDSFRISQEEKSPDRNLYIQRYVRPSSLLTCSESPVALANKLSPLNVKKSATIRSAKKK